MTRYLLRWILILSGVFLLPVLLIRARPYDDSELRAFLTPPEGCPAPCFMGIRPGVTAADEAVAILNAQGSITEAVYHEDANYIGWQWAKTYTGLLNTTPSGSVETRDDVVQNIVVLTNLKLGTLLAAYGSPRQGWAFRVWGNGGVPGMRYLLSYGPDLPDFGFFVPSRTWSGKLHVVLDTKITVYYGPETAADIIMTNPSLLDFLAQAAEFTDR